MSEPLSTEALDGLIKYHRDSLWSHRWQMSSFAEDMEKQTIQALSHYRDLCATIDGRDSETDSLVPAPSLPPLEATETKEQPV